MSGGVADGLSAEDLELLALLLEEAGIDDAEPETISPRRPGEPIPLTFAQKRLWFLEQLEPESRIYNNILAMRLVGELDADALERTLHELVRRHEALRTVYPEVDGEPVQVVLEDFRLPVEHRDLSGVPEEERMREVRRVADEVRNRPADLARGPLVSALLVRLGERDHALVMPIHHITSDGWSMGVFFRELAQIYDAFHRGDPSPLPPPRLQYGDFAVWLNQRLSGGALERQIAYWKERLRGVPTLLELPTDRPRPAEQSYRGAVYGAVIPSGVVGGVQALAQAEGATLFMVLLAGVSALLSRYSGSDDVVVGSPIAARTRPELEGVIGLFANTLPMRTDLSGDPSFRELLGRVRDGTFEDYANQDLPFERLVEELRIERSLSYNPVYQVLVVLQNAPMGGDSMGGIEMRSLDTTHDRAKLDLSLTLIEGGDGVFAGWEYATDLYDRDTIVRLTDHLVTLLRAAVEHPDRRVSELPLVTPEERTRVLRTWNESAGGAPGALPVHLRVDARAAAAPDEVALRHEGAALTYAELSRRSSRLAHHLRGRGVGPETRVGVCVERSPEMIVALLGVLKAGGAYVPLDPQYPRDRLAFLVEDSGIRVLLTQERLFADLPGSAAADVVFLDADRERIDAEPDTPPEVETHPESAAYVIYTSGSTGKPKGVLVPHGALAAFTETAREAYGIGAGDRVLQFASVNFDASAEEIYPALVSGACLVLRNEEMLGSAALFLEACRDWGITVLDLPTAYWHELSAELAGEGGAELPPGLRLVIIGGERALPERLRAWRESFGDRVRLVNTYGPTEATVVATMCDLPAGGRTTPRGTSPSAVRCAGRAPTCWTPRGSRRPSASPGSCTWAGAGWRAATWTARS